MFCKKCGSDVKNGVRFCPKCGKVLSGTGGISQPGAAGTGWGFQSGAKEGAGPSFQSGAKKGAGLSFQSGAKEGAGSSFWSGAGKGTGTGFQAGGTGGMKKRRRWIFIIIIAAVVLVLLAVFLRKKYNKRNSAAQTVEACMDAMQAGDPERALSYSDFAGNMEELITEITTGENFMSSNSIEDVFIQFLGGTQEWQGVLEHALMRAVQAYQITAVECGEETASIDVEIESPDFETAAAISGDEFLELLQDSYGMAEIQRIAPSLIIAFAGKNPIAIGNALKEVFGPLYDQWPEHIKKSMDTVDVRTFTVTLTLRKEDGKWIVVSGDLLDAAEKYAAEVGAALLPDLNL